MKALPAIITVTLLLLDTAHAAPTQQLKGVVNAAPCETLRTVPYQADAVATIRAKRGFVTQILLGPGEVILDKRGGDTEGWEVADLQGQGILTLKPRSNATDSNLIVTTDHRVYVMALNVLPNTSACAGNWQVSFKLPPPPVVAVITETPEMLAAKQAAKQAQEAARQAAKLKEDMKAVPPVINENYSMQAARASDDIIPNAVHDDGRFTYMKFYGNRELPAVFRVAADGEEITVNRHMQGRDVMVLHEVAKRWVLRLNRQAVGIWNDSFDINGVPPVAGTVSDQVQRITNGKELGDE